MRKELIMLFVLSVVVISACANNNGAGNAVAESTREVAEAQEAAPQQQVAPQQEEAPAAEAVPPQAAEVQLTSYGKNYYAFNQAAFDQAVADNKVVFLDFHADWCPICNREKPEILAAFNELNDDNVIGFEVHYKDGKDTPEEKALAKKYGITLQHTKVILKDGEVALKSLEGYSKDKVKSDINALV